MYNLCITTGKNKQRIWPFICVTVPLSFGFTHDKKGLFAGKNLWDFGNHTIPFLIVVKILNCFEFCYSWVSRILLPLICFIVP